VKSIEFSNPELVKRRESICNECEYKKYGMCQKCHCVLYVKVRLDNQQCPINKW